MFKFNFLRNWTKSAEERAQEQLHSYVDNALSPHEKTAFEQKMQQSPQLKANVEDLQAFKVQMRGLPQRPVPRQFTLDPAQYGRPARQPLVQLYPLLRGATALTAVFFIFTLFLNVSLQNGSVADSAPVAQNASPMEVAEGEQTVNKEATEASPTAVAPMSDSSEADEPAFPESASGAAEEALPVTAVSSDTYTIAPPVVEATPPLPIAPTATVPAVFALGTTEATATTSPLPREDLAADAEQRTSPTTTPLSTPVSTTLPPTTSTRSWQNALVGAGVLLLLFSLLTYGARRQML